MPARTETSLSIGIIGSGLGGLSAAISLRRAGHQVTLYERYDFGGEVGASLSVASNGSRFLEEWDINIPAAKPVILRNLIRHDYSTGQVEGTYPLGDYRERFGTDYNNFHRIDLHNHLKEVALSNSGKGCPAVLKTWHKASKLEPETGRITFENGTQATHDAIICADGIRSMMRQQLGIIPQFVPSTSCCYRCIIYADKLRELGLEEFINNNAIEFWGGDTKTKIVLSAWLDPKLITLFLNAEDIKMWRLYNHDPYPYWTKGRCTLLGDAAHPMMPDQSQGACMAIEDAGALGILFSEKYSDLTVEERLKLYEAERKPRATRIQEASKRARENLDERIGWSSKNTKPGMLTIDEVCGYDMYSHIAGLVADLNASATKVEASS
ncbi:hypothetical protein MRS44_009613 [Fusarium solani]|uniref:uncharacterized protein n=1 Tax=Fusarium solani TaxID=169388 RepID=UPI0032C4AD5F|nr:hypothetical protein MRS44_009613 [Fusarium solani]